VSVTQTLAEFLVRSRPEDLPDDVRHQAKRCLLNFLGTAIGGSRDDATARAAQVLARFAGKPETTVIGQAARMDALSASFVNAVSTNVFDFDDNHHNTIIHPAAPIAPGLFALAEGRPVRGAALLHAFVLGVEVACRLGNAVSPWHYKRGWHITSTCGVFGAAAGASRLLGLDAQRTGWAIGSASAQSAGLVETLGAMAKSTGVGAAARGGLLAALFAETGFTGPDEPIAGPRGFARVMGDAPNFAAITDGLGTRWEIMTNNPKPYPAGVVLNPVLDACFALRTRPGFALDRVARILVEGHPLLRERTDRPNVTTGREAQVSAQHAVAALLIHGAAGVPQFEDACVHSPDVLALRRKVEVADAPGIPVEAARVTITLDDGKTLAESVEHGRGTPGRPLTDAEIEAKIRDLVRYGCPGLDAGRIIDAAWSLDRAPDAGAVMKLVRPA
jgi:2-methylcitrate dehydratase PrpD